MSDDKTLPEPLVPADVDLRGLPSFMLNVDRLLASELVAVGTPAECWAALMLWVHAWKQLPAGSLPDDDRVLAAFSKGGKGWPKLKAMAMRGFIKCSDGRLYHKVLAGEVIEAWGRRVEYRCKTNDKTERQRRWRERVKQISAELRALGETPPMNASLETLERLLASASERLQRSTDVDHVGSTVDATETAKTGTGTGTGTLKKERKKDGADAPAQVASSFDFNGHERSDPKAALYERAKVVLREKYNGGVITNLLKAKNGSIPKARAALEMAADAGDAMEYLGGVIRGREREQDERNRVDPRL